MRRRLPHSLTATRPRQKAVDAVGRRLRTVGLAGVLADLDRAGEPCSVPGAAAGQGLTWDLHDREDHAWFPQGVTCLRSGAVLLVSWYAHRQRFLPSAGARVSVLDRTDPDAPRYRHVLLVTPRRPLGFLRLGAVRVHAGGIAVLGDLLYVADTNVGVRVFRLDDIARVPRRRWDAHGYDYVLPQLLRLRLPLRAGADRLKVSFLSVGEVAGQLSLVVGEYGRKGTTPRLVRYLLDPSTGLPAPGTDGRCAPLEVHERQPHRMQGVAVHGSTWFVTASSGKGNPGDLHVGSPGALHRHRGVLPTGPEDLDWSRPGEELWCVTEWPGHRWVFPIAAERWRQPPARAASA